MGRSQLAKSNLYTIYSTAVSIQNMLKSDNPLDQDGNIGEEIVENINPGITQ